jgi:uncharacterized repeat protein (TIGR01451 family)
MSGCGPEQPWVSELVSAAGDGSGAGNDNSWQPVMSPGGRYVAFDSWATNLGPVDDNGSSDVYLRDLRTGEVSLVSVTPSGAAAGGRSWRAVFSADDSTVAFNSTAPDIVPDGQGPAEREHIYVRDLASGVTRLVTENAAGTGRANWGGQTEGVSADGNLVLFTSYASDLVPNDANEAEDVFLRDVAAGTTTLVSVNAAGTSPEQGAAIGGPWLGPDGRTVVFGSISDDIAAHDTNGAYDVFVRDLAAGTTRLLSANADGTDTAGGDTWVQGLSPDGRTALVYSEADDLGPPDTNGTPDVFTYDLATGEPTLVSVNAAGTSSAAGSSMFPAFSRDATMVVFQSTASDFGPVDSPCVNGYRPPPEPQPTGPCPDLYVRDLVVGTTTLVTTNPEGTDSNRRSGGREYRGATFSPDGTRVLFETPAGGLGPADGNRATDVYVRDLVERTTTLVAHKPDQSGSVAEGAFSGSFGADGTQVAYVSASGDLGPVDANDRLDVYLATFEAADLGITLSASPAPAGGEVVFTLDVTNGGPDPADGTVANLLLPEGTTFASATGSCEPPVPADGRVVTCDLGTLEEGASAGATVTATVTAPAGTTLEALATTDAAPADTDRTDNESEATVTVT